MRKLRIKIPRPSPIEFEFDEMQKNLNRFEEITARCREIEGEHEEVFSELAELEDEMDTVRQAMKRIAYSDKGPPDGVKGRTFSPVTGKRLEVRIVYKKRADYFDANRLPADVLNKPGVVAGVDTLAVNAILEDLENSDPSKLKQRKAKKIRSALMRGGWMTPSLSISKKG